MRSRKKRVLFNGCSHTATSGFNPENLPKYHWPWLISQHYDWYFTNVAIGGSSNEEIFYRTLEHCHVGQYDLCVVMWSALGRKWAYHSQNNVDDFTILNPPHPLGFKSALSEVKEYAKLHYAYFDNHFINLKTWLLQVRSLHDVFIANGQKYIFIKGFDNHIDALSKASFIPGQGFQNLNWHLKKMLNFDALPDYLLNIKLETLQVLLKKIECCQWVNLHSTAFNDAWTDRADDRMHPGILANHAMAEKTKIFLDQNAGQFFLE